MEKRVTIDINTLKFLYERQKAFIIPVIVIVVCFILLLKFIMPQFQALFTLGREAKKDSSRINVLKNNLNLLSNLSDSTLDSQVQILTVALPTNKDFIGIIDAISYASSVAGVNVAEFQLQIGDLSQAPTDTSAFSSISLNLSVNGSVDDINKFIKALYTTLPLSEVTSIGVGNTSSTVAINFSYKPLPPVTYNDATPIHPIPNSGLTLINKLSNFNYKFSSSFEPINSSPSSVINPL